MSLYAKTENGDKAVILGEHEGFFYGFIEDTDRGPNTILHMRWDANGKAHGVTGQPILAINWDIYRIIS